MVLTHKPVLLNETIEALNIRPDGRYVDGTLGLGGHSEAIVQKLSKQGKLLGLDVDATNLQLAENRLQPSEDQTITRQVNFRGLQGVLQEIGWPSVDGILVDLGISSVQLDDPARGFSIQNPGPLDMRLNPQQSETALSVLNRLDESELYRLLVEFGDGPNAKRLSRELVRATREKRLSTTDDLARLCERVVRSRGFHRGRIHPATRVFLALRVLVNDELESLKQFLDTAPFLLAEGGRLVVISFHSLEDRLVKYRFRALAQESSSSFKLVTKKPIIPTEDEQRDNPRSRSAKLRVLEKVSQ